MDTTDPLLGRRIVALRGNLDGEAATDAIAKLRHLESIDRTEPAHLHIDSSGGLVSAALALRDAIDELACPVATHCIGEASGVAVALLAHGARGSRTAIPGATLSFVTVTSSSSDERDLRRSTALIVEMIARDSGTPASQVDADHRSNRRFDAPQAHSYGLIDSIER